MKEVGTLVEIGAQVGDVVAERDVVMTVVRIDLTSEEPYLMRQEDGKEDWYMGVTSYWRIVTRAKPTGPVITETVTTKRIVPGVYGKVEVLERKGGLQVWVQHCMTHTDILAAIDTLQQIADAMSENSHTQHL